MSGCDEGPVRIRNALSSRVFLSGSTSHKTNILRDGVPVPLNPSERCFFEVSSDLRRLRRWEEKRGQRLDGSALKPKKGRRGPDKDPRRGFLGDEDGHRDDDDDLMVPKEHKAKAPEKKTRQKALGNGAVRKRPSPEELRIRQAQVSARFAEFLLDKTDVPSLLLDEEDDQEQLTEEAKEGVESESEEVGNKELEEKMVATVRTWSEAGRPDKIYAVLANSREAGDIPTPTVYNTALKSLTWLSRSSPASDPDSDPALDLASRTYEEMKTRDEALGRAGVYLRPRHYRMLVKTLCKARRFDQARSVFEDALEALGRPSGVEPAGSQAEEPIGTSDEAGNVQVNDQENGQVTKHLRGQEEEVEAIRCELAKELMMGYVLAGELGLAKSVLGSSPGLFPMRDPTPYNTLIGALGKAKEVGGALDVLEMMVERNVEVNDETYEVISNAVVRDIKEPRHVTSIEELPTEGLPEVAFLGLSNVGKSSLVNLVAGRRSLAFKSMKPGTTTRFNFYLLNAAFYLVDFPGLGYAEVGPRLQQYWFRFHQEYLPSREQLKLVFHLMDGRKPPSKEDIEIMKIMASRRNDSRYVVALTKTDMLPAEKSHAWAVQQIQKALRGAGGDETQVPILLTSSRSKRGRLEIWRLLKDLAKL